MAVIVNTPKGTRIFCKGSPEKISDICIPETVP